MLKLTAMIDGGDAEYPCLGSLRPMEGGASGRPVALVKRISVYNLGRYTKRLTTPLYQRQAMTNFALHSPQHRLEPANCKGVLCSTLRCKPQGYVTRSSGGHRFCLPVYDSKRLSGNFYRVKGYMLTEEGYLAVATRRWLLWLCLGLLSGVCFVTTYLTLQYGAQGAWDELVRFFSTLPATIQGLWP